MMTFVKRLNDGLWGTLAKMILPDPVLRLDQLDVDPAQIEREYQHLLAQRRRKKPLEATWAPADAGVPTTAEHKPPSESQRGKATLEPKGSQGR